MVNKFNPKNLKNLNMWLDASDEASLVRDKAGNVIYIYDQLSWTLKFRRVWLWLLKLLSKN